MTCCSKGCCELGLLLYGNPFKEAKAILMQHAKEDVEVSDAKYRLENYAAYSEMILDICRGEHPNYMLSSYCVKIGHVDCFRVISQLPMFRYNIEIVIWAIESDNVEMTRFLLQNYYEDNYDWKHVLDSLQEITVGPLCATLVVG